MADPTIIHVHPYGNLWKVKIAQASFDHSVHRTRSEATEAGIELAKQYLPSKVIVHREDGTVESERLYSIDTNPPDHQ